MSFYMGGLAIVRCWQHERAAEIGPTARIVLAVMAAHIKEPAPDPPVFYGSQATLAIRSGLSERSVRNALDELQALKIEIEGENLGAIERDGKRGKTVRWRLNLLSARGADKSNPTDVPHRAVGADYGLSARGADKSNPAPRADKNPAPRADKNPAPRADNHSESYRGLPREDDDSRSGTASSADAPLAPERSDSASRSPATNGLLIEMVVTGLGYAPERAPKWIEQTLGRARQPVVDPVAYIRTAIERERKRVAAKRAAPAAPKPATARNLARPARSGPCADCGESVGHRAWCGE